MAGGRKQRDPEALGSCGCVDYHMADCPTRTGGSGMTSEDWYEFFARGNYDEYYDDGMGA